MESHATCESHPWMQCVAGPISHQSCSQVALQQPKSCKVSKIKKPGDGDGADSNTIHSLYLAVTSDCSSQVLTAERIIGCVHQPTYMYMYAVLLGRASRHESTITLVLPSSVSAQASSVKNLRCTSHSAAAAIYAPCCLFSPHSYLTHIQIIEGHL